MKHLMIGIMLTVTMANYANQATKTTGTGDFEYIVDRFADIEILRYRVPGIEELTLQQKRLLFHLSEAALMGRDILFDQNNRYNLAIRRSLEAIYIHDKTDRNDPQFKALETYLKRIWFANGIHHHYSEDKFKPDFTAEYFAACIRRLDEKNIPLRKNQTVDQWLAEITPIIFRPDIMPKRTVQSTDIDPIVASSNNYYEGDITLEEVESFYANMKKPDDPTPVSYGLNSRLVKKDGRLFEETWKVGGLYTEAIEQIIIELEKATPFTENDQQKAVIETLIEYYRTGDLKTFDAYAILWVNDMQSAVDFVNGFTETYGDPLGMKASWESTVNFINLEATKRTQIISNQAQWFEDHSPTDPRFKKKEVKGVSAKVITVAMLGGDCYPSTPIGINLPNADWIRRDHGSKSVTIENITQAYDKASQGNGFNDEFAWSETERDLMKKYGYMTDNLHTDLHECLGHGSGMTLPNTDTDALKTYSSTLEETRADLFALYFLADNKIIELGLLPDSEAYKSEYYKFMMNGLMTQLARIEAGKDIEEAHMRNRQLIARWVYEKGKAGNIVELKERAGKTYVVVNDYNKLRELFGKLLAEVQRIKSEGDFEAGKQLVETYGIKVDPKLHHEVINRYAKLNLAPYKGFVNPVMTEVKNESDEVIDIKLDYTEEYTRQMLRYSEKYSFLPTYNECLKK